MQKLSHLQTMRAMAAILVVWAHAIDIVVARGETAAQINFGFAENFGAVGVDIFFVISGFIVSISAGRTTPLQFTINRTLRIWPMYIIATMLMFLVSTDTGGQTTKLIYSLLFLQPPGNAASMPIHPLGWSLMYEVAFYAVICAAMLWKSPRPLSDRILFILAGLIAVGSMQQFAQPLNIIGNPILLEFVFGVLIGMVWQRTPLLPSWATLGMFILGSCLLIDTLATGYGNISEAPFTLDASSSWDRVRTWGIPSALLVASAVFRENTKKATIFEFIGDASYSIYLFSLPMLHFMDAFWPENMAEHNDVLILLATLSTTIGGCLVYLILEKPVMRLLRGQRRASTFMPGAA